jgi:hypothetical protein
LQELCRQSKRIIGDLVLITGSGQHSTGGPVLRSSVQRLLASLQLAPDTVDADGGSIAPSDTAAGGIGTAFTGYTRFTGRMQPQPDGVGPMPPLGVAAQQQQHQQLPSDTGVHSSVYRSIPSVEWVAIHCIDLHHKGLPVTPLCTAPS